MTKWNLQNEKPIQELFTAPCWVQRQNGGIYCLFPRRKSNPSEKYLDCLKINTGNGAPAEVYLCDSFFPCDEIVAWQYFELPAAPEPYVPAPKPAKMKAEWIDGAVRVPEVRWVGGRLVRQILLVPGHGTTSFK